MKGNQTFFHTTRCILAAYRLERCWKKLLRTKKRERAATGQPSRRLALRKARVRYLTERYDILVKGADRPERLAI